MKEAVVLILDANDSMAAAKEGDAPTRFDCAKQVAMDMLSDLMIRSKTHEAAVLVLKTNETQHYFFEKGQEASNDDVPFPNITELGGDGVMTGVNRIHPDLLRQIQQLEVTSNSKELRGDFCDGIIVAADALYRKTSGKKYQRRIVLITDAEHKVCVDHQQLLVVLDSLRAMECRLEVIGMDFEKQADYKEAVQVKQEDSSTAPNEDEHPPDPEEDHPDSENDEDDASLVKQQNEVLLLGLTEKTGGFVLSATDLQPILRKVLGQRSPKSTRRKIEFHIAPGLAIDARFSLLLSKASTPTLKKQVVEVEGSDDDPKVKRDALGLEIANDYQTIVSHWNPDNEAQEVTDIAHAYRYGSDLVPMGGLDMTGLIRMSPVRLTILGYMALQQVPAELRIGPSYALSGADSLKACASIAAIARALQQNEQIGVATLVKSKDSDPILVGLFPLEPGSAPTHLCMLQLPFRGDVTQLPLEGFEAVDTSADPSAQQTCDDMIDSLMLPEDVLDYSHIPNPYLRSFHQTVVQRVLDPNCKIHSVRPPKDGKDTADPMSTPADILNNAQPALDAFRKRFVLTKVANSNIGPGGSANKKRKGPATYHDSLDDMEE